MSDDYKFKANVFIKFSCGHTVRESIWYKDERAAKSMEGNTIHRNELSSNRYESTCLDCTSTK